MSSKATNLGPDMTPKQRFLLVTIDILLGVVAGQAGAILAVLGGSTVPEAIKAGAVAFSGTVTLAIAIMYAIRRL